MNSFIPIPQLNCLLVSGPDAEMFLQSQLTINIKNCDNHKARIAAYCEPKGRVISTLIIVCLGPQSFLLLLPETLSETVLNKFLLYRFRAKVEFKADNNYQCYACLESSPGDDLESCLDTYKEAVEDQPVIRFQHPLATNTNFFIVPRPTELFNNSIKFQKSQQLWCQHEIKAGMVWLDLRTTEKHLPQSLGLIEANAIDFDKGCYPGQEIIARLHYLGKSKYVLQAFISQISNQKIEIDNIRDSTGKRQGQSLNYCIIAGMLSGLATIRQSALSSRKRLYVNEQAIQIEDN